MPSPFSSKRYRPESSAQRDWLSRLLPHVRRHPFLIFGLPFTLTIVSGAFGLSYLTQTRYDYNAIKVQSVSKGEELGMRKDRRKVDLREEYWRLAQPAGSSSGKKGGNQSGEGGEAGESDWDDWEPKRIQRPEGQPEWGIAGVGSGSYVEEQGETRDYKGKGKGKGRLQAEGGPPLGSQYVSISEPDRRGNRTAVTATGRKVVIGPDGKPCRACNDKLAFAEAMRGATGGGGSASGSGSGGKASSMFGGIMAATGASSSAATSSPAPAVPQAAAAAAAAASSCPPDVEELGRSSWDLLHSIAATYPDSPSNEERQSLLHLLQALPVLYPCGYCASALQDDYQRRQQQSSTRDDPTQSEAPVPAESLTPQAATLSHSNAMRFTCSIHNEVNQRLGKPKWDCEDLQRLKQRWIDGGRPCL